MPRNQYVQEFLKRDGYIEISDGNVAGACTLQVITGAVYMRLSDAGQPAATATGLKIEAGYGWIGKSLNDIMPSGGHTRVWVKALTYPTSVLIDHA